MTDYGLGNICLVGGAVDHTTANGDDSRRVSSLRRSRSAARVGSTAPGELVVGGRSTAPAGGQRALEGVPEVAVEQRVDERVERRVDVADPEQDGDDDGRRLRAELAAHRVVDVPREERQPAAEKPRDATSPRRRTTARAEGPRDASSRGTRP